MSSWLFQMFRIDPSQLCKTAIEDDRQILSYDRLSQEIDRLRIHLEKQGISEGDHVAFIAHPTLSSILLLLALSSLGASVCPLNFRLTENQIQRRLAQGHFSYFVESENYTVLKTSFSSPFRLPPSLLLFTSGSQGDPKLAVLSLDNLLYNALGSLHILQLDKQPSCWLLSLPLFHVSGLSILFRCFLSQNSVRLSSAPLDIALKESSPTHLSLVPTQLLRLLKYEKNLLSPLHCILLGGAPISLELLKKGLDRHLPLFLSYGMTEMGSQITTAPPSELKSYLHFGSVLPFREVKIVEGGEIYVKGKTLFQGYLLDHNLVQPFDSEGWFATKDMGKWTEKRELIFKGRKDNMFISGGENIHPEEVEKALCQLSNVLQAVVVPIDDREYGQRALAFIQYEGPSFKKDEILEQLKDWIPKHALPCEILPFPEDLPSHEMKWERTFFKQRASLLSASQNGS